MQFRLVALLASIAAFLPLVTDGFLPAVRPMMAEFGVDVSRAQLATSIALAGFAVAQLVIGMLADRIGRRPVLVAAIVLLAIASTGVAFAPSLEVLLALRFLQGVAAAAGPVLARAIVRDLVGRVEGARVLSYVGMGLALVPLSIPALNAWLTAAVGWRWSLATYVAYLAAVLAMALAWCRETLAARDPDAMSLPQTFAAARRVIRTPPALGAVLCCVFGYGGLAIWISAAPHLLLQHYGVPAAQFGVWWAVPVVTYVLGGYLSARGLRRHSPDAMLRFGTRLTLAAGIALLALWNLDALPLPAFIATIGLYNAGWSIVFPQSQAAALAHFPDVAGRVSAVLGFVQMLGAALFGLLFGALYDGTPGAAAILVATLAACTTLVRATLATRPVPA